jgi:hypothetical protein
MACMRHGTRCTQETRGTGRTAYVRERDSIAWNENSTHWHLCPYGVCSATQLVGSGRGGGIWSDEPTLMAEVCTSRNFRILPGPSTIRPAPETHLQVLSARDRSAAYFYLSPSEARSIYSLLWLIYPSHIFLLMHKYQQFLNELRNVSL